MRACWSSKSGSGATTALARAAAPRRSVCAEGGLKGGERAGRCTHNRQSRQAGGPLTPQTSCDACVWEVMWERRVSPL